jgi:hypothetical protein
VQGGGLEAAAQWGRRNKGRDAVHEIYEGDGVEGECYPCSFYVDEPRALSCR